MYVASDFVYLSINLRRVAVCRPFQPALRIHGIVSQVATQAREMSSEHFTRFMNDLTNKHIFELVNSQVVHEKIGGIMAIGTHQPLFTVAHHRQQPDVYRCVSCAASR